MLTSDSQQNKGRCSSERVSECWGGVEGVQSSQIGEETDWLKRRQISHHSTMDECTGVCTSGRLVGWLVRWSIGRLTHAAVSECVVRFSLTNTVSCLCCCVIAADMSFPISFLPSLSCTNSGWSNRSTRLQLTAYARKLSDAIASAASERESSNVDSVRGGRVEQSHLQDRRWSGEAVSGTRRYRSKCRRWID